MKVVLIFSSISQKESEIFKNVDVFLSMSKTGLHEDQYTICVYVCNNIHLHTAVCFGCNQMQ